MKLKRIRIKNFRKLSDIDLPIGKDITVIVGPNAVGKSSIFEAIRLAKAILFPRGQDELRQVLIALGAASAHFAGNQLQYDISSLAGDPNQPLSITLTIAFSDEELSTLPGSTQQIARSLLGTQLGRGVHDLSNDLIGYLATPIGQKAEADAIKSTHASIQQLTEKKEVDVSVTIGPFQINGSDAIHNLIIGQIERRLPPEKTIFSYFPADRSLPAGEVAIQIGPQDFKAQMDSHFAQAIGKYGRLKQTVVNRAVLARISDVDLKGDFDSIFDAFLPGKEFIGLQQKPSGLVNVLVKDKASGKVFDIDSLSSGEKGLVLSFLLFKTSLISGSISMVDELELHLNPAVCRKILPYLAENVASKIGCQFIISTHSAEITRDAFDREDTELFHLRSGSDISPILKQDQEEVIQAINLLGVSAEQALTAKSLLYVEGDSDVDILESAFPDLLFGVGVQSLKGRTEIEKSIKKLQDAEKRGVLKESQSFLFDNDRKTTSLIGTNLVRIEQLERYCIENYLLDAEVLFDVVKRHAGNPPESRGSFSSKLKVLALNQLDGVITNELLSEFRLIRIGLSGEEVRGKSLLDVAKSQLEKLKSIEKAISEKTEIDDDNWIRNFSERHAQKKSEQQPIWENDWKKLCSGKVLFDDLQREYTIHKAVEKFKCEVATEMARQRKDDITTLKGIIGRLLAK